MPSDSEYEEFLQELQEKAHADSAEVSLAFTQAKEILGKELRDTADVQERRRRSPWVHGYALNAPAKRTEEALDALAPRRRELVVVIMQVLRDTNWPPPLPDPLSFI